MVIKNEAPVTRADPTVVWVITLFLLTFFGALPFIIGRINFHGLNSSTRLPFIASTGLGLIAFAPSIAALIVSRFHRGVGGIRPLLAQVLIWRVNIAWYVAALIGPIILRMLSNTIQNVMGNHIPEYWVTLPSLPGLDLDKLLFIVFAIPIGAFGEELGWRGFAQAHLQKRSTALVASIFVGVIWGTWHLWYVMTPGGFLNVSVTDAVATYVRLISTSIIYTWMYNSTRGSIFVVTMAHAGHNVSVTLIQSPSKFYETNHLINALCYLATAIIVLCATNARTLSPSSRSSKPQQA